MEEPKPPKGEPEMPKGMSTAAKRYWRMYVDALTITGVLTIVDGVALREACVSAALAERYSKVTLEEPMVEEPLFSKDGTLVGYKHKPNPALAGYIACSKNMKAFQIEFGLTPASRVKLKIEKKPDDPTLTPQEPLIPQADDEQSLAEIDETVIQ